MAVRRRKDGLETLIARLLENGQLDLEFGEERTGFVEISLKDGLYMHSMLELTPFPDGGWLVRAEYQSNGPVVSAGLVVVKQDQDGRLDQDFAEQGVRYLPYAQMGARVIPATLSCGRTRKFFWSAPSKTALAV